METNSKQIITMSSLGKQGHGRFGNQVFQYAFLKIYAAYYSLGVETNRWVGQYLFGHQDPPVTHTFPMYKPNLMLKGSKLKAIFKSNSPPFVNIDLCGYFHFPTGFYRPFKSLFRSLFQPAPYLSDKVSEGVAKLRKRGNTIIGIHLRRGDFNNFNNHSRMWIAPTSWYNEWLKRIWPTLDKPVLFIASDDTESVLPRFKKYHPITSQDVINEFPNDTSFYPDASFYPDYYILTQCDQLAISNSTFSFAASMLNERCRCFMRPYYGKHRLVPFNPWNGSPRLSRNVRRIAK